MLNSDGQLALAIPGGAAPGASKFPITRSRAALILTLVALAACMGCAAPAPPQPPTKPVPGAVTDLRAHQAGAAVILHFTLPSRTTTGTQGSGPWRVEIYREFSAAPSLTASSAPPASAQMNATRGLASEPAYTVGAKQLADDLTGNTVTFRDELSPKELLARRGDRARYRVRTSVDGGGWSELSRPASVILAIPPAPVMNLRAEAVAGAVILHWTAPAANESPAPQAFAIYRSQLNQAGTEASLEEAIGMTTGTSYRDTSAESGQSYRYAVRGTAPAPGGEVESADSAPVVVAVPPLSVPEPPEGLEAIPVRDPTGSLEVDLSWAIGGEKNLAGYNVYRSARSGPEASRRDVRLNAKPLAATTFRDTQVEPGRSYSYTVTAMDSAGQESSPSEPVTVTVPGANPR